MGLIGAEFDGGELVLSALQNATEELQAKVNELIQEAGINTEADAKQACPVDTGRLRASIKYTPGEMECTVYTNVEYAAFVEWGTVHQQAQPYLYPAFENNGQKLIDALRDI